MGILRRAARSRRRSLLLVAGTLLAATSACSSGASSSDHPGRAVTTGAHTRQYVLESAVAYKPYAPPGATDDYHCTLVDPHVTQNSMIVTSQFFPNSPEVHHAILFLVPPALAAAAEAANAGGKGWTCFGETPIPHTMINIPLSNQSAISNTSWLSAWAPGAGVDHMPAGTGVPFPAGSLVVMQVHYNLLVGDNPVRVKLVLTTVPAAGSHLKPLALDLLPAPPDIPCPAGITGPLCNRAASLANLGQRFGPEMVGFVDFLERYCGRNPVDPPGGDTTSCTWPVYRNEEIVRLTAHMHYIGTGMTIVLDPGTPKERTLLDVTNYNFHYQRSYNLAKPVPVGPGDSLRVSCTYNPYLRQQLPQLRAQPARYVTWGDGTTDEMCLGIVQSIDG